MNEKLLSYFKGDEMAANVWKSKYAMEGEKTPDDMHRRLAKEFARVDKKYQEQEQKKEVPYLKENLSKYGLERKDLTENSIYKLFKDFEQIVPQGSIMYGLGRKDKFISLSNCFYIGEPETDSYNGIMNKDEQLVQLMKRRAGVGLSIASLRPRGTRVTNSAGTSSGAASFMERFSNSTREVGQENRRGALLMDIDVRHPDVGEFVTIKEDKTKVTGANISVKLWDEFMDAVVKDKDYILRHPIDTDLKKINSIKVDGMEYGVLKEFATGIRNQLGKPLKTVHLKKVKAKKLWETIIKQARDNSEPGLLFWDNVVNYGPDGVYDKYRPNGTNPLT